MTYTKTIKTMLFASLIAAMILPFSVMDLAEAKQDDKQRLEIKKQQIRENFQTFLEVREQADDLEKQLDEINSQIDDPTAELVDSLLIRQHELTTTLGVLYDQIDELQDASYALHEIPEKKQAKLEKTLSKILNKHEKLSKNPESAIEDVFIDVVEEKIVVMKNNKFDAKNNSMKQKVASMESDVRSTVQAEDVEVVITEITPQSHNNSSPCNNNSERDDYCQPAAGGVQIKGASLLPGYAGKYETSTLSFPATRNNISGFVMVGHGTLGQSGGEDIYQPYYPYKIGDLVLGSEDDEYGCDCSFIDLSPGRTVANEVVYNGALLTINGQTSKANQVVGQYVMKSGIATNNTWGQIVSVNNSDSDWVYANYSSASTDSGSPVGKVSGSNINIYGIHRGGSPNGQYAAIVPYDTIKSHLGLD